MNRVLAASVLLAAACGREDPADRPSSASAVDLGPRLAGAIRALQDEHGSGDEAPEFYPTRDGWLGWKATSIFAALNPEWFPAAPDPILADGPALETIVDLARQLREIDVDFLVVPLPSRLNVYPEVLIEAELGESFAGFAPGLRRWMLGLGEAGVEVLDLLPALAAARGSLASPDHEQVFLRVNSHWTPLGVSLAADEIAAHVRAYDWFEPGPLDTRLEPFEASWSHPRQDLPDGADPAELRFERVTDAAGTTVPSSDRNSPIQLLGGSFTILYEEQGADLARQLRHRLGYAPDVIASPGGAAQACRRALQRRRGALESKRLVIWVFVAWSMLPRHLWKPLEIVGG